jgi:hypothetical protein
VREENVIAVTPRPYASVVCTSKYFYIWKVSLKLSQLGLRAVRESIFHTSYLIPGHD